MTGDEVVNRTLVLDWAATASGAKLQDFTGPNLSRFGCGPRQALDGSLSTGWASTLRKDPRLLVVKLSRPVNVDAFAIDPAAACGLPRRFGLNAFAIQTRTNHRRWIPAASGKVSLGTEGLRPVRPRRGRRHVRYVRILLKSNHTRGQYVSLTELSVRGKAVGLSSKRAVGSADRGAERPQPAEALVAATHADSSRSGPNTAFGM